MRGLSFGVGSFRAIAPSGETPWITLWSGVQVHERTGRCFAYLTEGSFGNTSQAGSQDQGHRGRNQPEGIYRRPEILCRTDQPHERMDAPSDVRVPIHDGT